MNLNFITNAENSSTNCTSNQSHVRTVKLGEVPSESE